MVIGRHRKVEEFEEAEEEDEEREKGESSRGRWSEAIDSEEWEDFDKTEWPCSRSRDVVVVVGFFSVSEASCSVSSATTLF